MTSQDVGCRADRSARLAAQIIDLYPPPSDVTVLDIMRETGESHKTVSRALSYLARKGKAQKSYIERVGVRHYAHVWRLS